jgi:cytochrome c nitrite reductase small subunit
MKKGIAMVTVLAALTGAAAGLAGYTFVYGKGHSYLTNNPSSCANCHVMQDHYDGWMKSTHRNVATCNDCHTPSGFVAKYWTKADNGFFHSLAFTTGEFEEPIRAKARNQRIAEEACFKCHSDIVHDIVAVEPTGQKMSCVRCHSSVGHMR